MELSESLAFLLRYHTKGAQKCFKLTTLQRFFMTEILPYYTIFQLFQHMTDWTSDSTIQSVSYEQQE